MVSLEIPYYPCLFGQTKSVPGIKYRILGDGENNYYESFKSVPYLYLYSLLIKILLLVDDNVSLLNKTLLFNKYFISLFSKDILWTDTRRTQTENRQLQ